VTAPGLTIRWLTGLLDEIGIEHMVVGSFASSAHGVPRTTQDIDVVFDPSPESLARFLAAIDLERYYVDTDTARDALRRRGMFNVIDAVTGWKIDLIVRKNTPHAREELRRRVRGRVAGVPAPLASAEDVIIVKLSWARDAGSDRQLRDVAGIVATRGDQLDRAYLDRWITELELAPTWARAQALAAE
jgi:hypothetical protein